MAKTPRRRCAFCSRPLAKDARSNQKYCDADCRRGRVKPRHLVVNDSDVLDAKGPRLGPVATATDLAIADAVKERRIGPLDVGTVAAIRVLARKIDEEQERWDAVLTVAAAVAAEEGTEGRAPKPPPVDNVSIPTYLRYAESLGLTPSGRKEPIAPEKGKESKGGSKLDKLTGAIPRPK